MSHRHTVELPITSILHVQQHDQKHKKETSNYKISPIASLRLTFALSLPAERSARKSRARPDSAVREFTDEEALPWMIDRSTSIIPSETSASSTAPRWSPASRPTTWSAIDSTQRWQRSGIGDRTAYSSIVLRKNKRIRFPGREDASR